MPVIKIHNMPVTFYYGHIMDYLKKSFTPQFRKKPLISYCGLFYYFISIKYENFTICMWQFRKKPLLSCCGLFNLDIDFDKSEVVIS
jgi:hypothetical protein